MRATWEALHRSLGRSTGTWLAQKEFNEEKSRRQILRRFDTPADMVCFLTTGKEDLDDKDRVFAALVQWVQDGDKSNLATSLLWIGLWPGLDNLHGRLRRFFPKEPGALVSEIGTHFTLAVHRLDLGRVERVAATLLRNTEREFHRARRTRSQAEAREVALREGDEEAAPADQHTESMPSPLGLPPGLDPEQQIAAIREFLVAELGGDADLLISVVLLGERQCDAASRLGLGRDAVFMRLRRALDRLRKNVASEK